jgi:hypothetical protein
LTYDLFGSTQQFLQAAVNDQHHHQDLTVLNCLTLLCAGYTYEPMSGVLSLQSTVNAAGSHMLQSAAITHCSAAAAAAAAAAAVAAMHRR